MVVKPNWPVIGEKANKPANPEGVEPQYEYEFKLKRFNVWKQENERARQQWMENCDPCGTPREEERSDRVQIALHLTATVASEQQMTSPNAVRYVGYDDSEDVRFRPFLDS